MAQYSYKARDMAGRVKTGVISASSRDSAKSRLGQMRLRPIELKEAKLDSSSKKALVEGEVEYIPGILYKDAKGRILITIGEQVTSKDIIVFSKQLSTMINSGVPLIQSLDLLAKQQATYKFKRILTSIRLQVENGAKLSDSFAMFPQYFDNLYVSMIRAGEASGSLDIILLKLVEYIEKAEQIRKKIKGAMAYPAIVVMVAIGVVSALLIFVVPTFATQFQESGKPLPELTQFLVSLSEAFQSGWHKLLLIAVVTILAIKAAAKTPNGKLYLDHLLLRIPLTGNLLKKVAVGRFCSTLSTMLSSGVNLLEALTICAASSGNRPIEDFIINVRSRVEQGEKLSTPLSKGNLFPEMVVSMVAVGENTGALDEMLKKVSAFYEEEVEIAVAALLSMIEPLLIVGLGGIIGFVVIALYLPIFDLASTV
ncbi:MAG: type II secretion system F family protein [Oligoflexales bacterium]|nr:type II secretion system F family protein [Oligoflexales bacterium]